MRSENSYVEQEQVKEIRSDNGTGFVSASSELKKALKVLNQSKTQKWH